MSNSHNSKFKTQNSKFIMRKAHNSKFKTQNSKFKILSLLILDEPKIKQKTVGSLSFY